MKTIVVYASKYGCVKKCCEEIRLKLKGDIDIVDIDTVGDVDLNNYNNIILGCSVYIGSVQKSIKNFCKKNLSVLLDKSVSIFICCLFEDQLNDVVIKNFPNELINHAKTIKSFKGEIKYEKLHLLDKVVYKALAKTINLDCKINDKAINEFLAEILSY